MGTASSMDPFANHIRNNRAAWAYVQRASRRSELWLLTASLISGLLFPLIDGRFGPVAEVFAKGLGVGTLALAAALAPGRRWLAGILTAGVLGDVLLELPGGLIAGGAAFAIGHVISIAFYTRNRRAFVPMNDRFTAAALIGYGLAMPVLIMPTGAPVGALMVYSVLLCGMAAAALISRFARQWAALGALLFVVSDTLLIMRMSGRLVGGDTLHGLLVWYFYYFGQLGIFIGVSRGLAKND